MLELISSECEFLLNRGKWVIEIEEIGFVRYLRTISTVVWVRVCAKNVGLRQSRSISTTVSGASSGSTIADPMLAMIKKATMLKRFISEMK